MEEIYGVGVGVVVGWGIGTQGMPRGEEGETIGDEVVYRGELEWRLEESSDVFLEIALVEGGQNGEFCETVS
jgi:hypothetical protein